MDNRDQRTTDMLFWTVLFLVLGFMAGGQRQIKQKLDAVCAAVSAQCDE